MALSRARLGLYVLGRRAVFEACYELREAFDRLLRRPDKLALVTGEMWPAERVLPTQEGGDGAGGEVPGEAVMEGVEHLGQYVFEMTQTRVEMVRGERGLLPLPEGAGEVEVEGLEEGYEGLVVEDGEGGDEGGEEEEEGPVRGEGFELEEDE